ncbi:MAG: PorT family protein [Muribaculaceae bacterium]|nr:PorT family protein [Muribaculaceae bacterium]
MLKKILPRPWMLPLTLLILMLFVAPTAWGRPGDKIQNRPYADLKRWHLGFSVGTHFQDLDFTHNGLVTPEGEQWMVEVPAFDPGICVNVLADLRLHKYFNLRFSPGMYFGSKGIQMREVNSGATERQDIKTAWVVMPLDLKISGDRLHNSRPYVTLGGMLAFDVAKKRSDFLQFNSTDFFLSVGLGCDFYLPFFKLNPEIKFCFGLTDILKHNRPDLDENPDMYKITQSLGKVKSKMVVITFYFE